jgi:exodeoxyribonuclease V beta subunit
MKTLDLTKQIPLNKTCLIEASAGTGKTYSIANIFLHAVLSGIPVEQILVVTFTEAATKELRSRIRANIVKALDCLKEHKSSDETLLAIIFELFAEVDEKTKLELLETALLNIDQAAIFTIHSFCQRMLTENSFESKIAYGAELLTDTSELIQELAENFWRDNLLNISEADKVIYGDIKFDDIVLLTKELVRYHDVEVVNNELEEPSAIPPVDEELNRKYETIIAESKAWLAKFETADLKITILELFRAIQTDCNKAYRTDLEIKLDKLVMALKAQSSSNVQFFTQERIDKNAIGKKSLNNGIRPPKHELFAFCDCYLAVLKSKKAADTAIAEALANNQKTARIKLYNRLNRYIKIKFNQLKAERNVLTFDDLLVRLYEALAAEKKSTSRPLTALIRAKFSLALVDEFQDTDNIQYEIFNILFGAKDGKHGFFMIGDPKQSIYKFRGADIFSYLTAKKNADEQFTLNTNYRSEPSMVNAVNELFKIKGDETFAFAPKADQPGIVYEAVEHGARKARLIDPGGNSKPLQFWLVNDYNDKFAERKIARNIAMEIIRLIDVDQASFADGRLLNPGDIAILTNTNKQAALVKNILAESKIPAVIQNSLKIFESWEARELQLWLNAIVNPIERHIRPLFITNLLKQSVEQIDEVQDQDILALTEELTLLNKLWQANGFFSIFLRFLHQHQVQEQALTLLNGERIMTNYIHLAELLHKYELKNGRGIEKILSYLAAQIDDSDDDDEYMQRLESDDRAVKIMTIHKSKGLEFPIVFCPFLWNNAITKGEGKQKIFLFNKATADGYIQQMDLGANKAESTTNRLLARSETVAEHIRLMYVATTRAANRCYLPIAEINKTAMSVLAYIFTPYDLDNVIKNTPQQVGAKLAPLLNDIIANISQFTANGVGEDPPGNIGLTRCDDEPVVIPQLKKRDTGVVMNLEAKNFTQKNLYKWGVGSFSSLIKNQPYHHEKTALGPAVFSLPKGKVFGLAVHAIFQNYFTLGKQDFYADLAKNLEAPLKVESYFRSANTEIRQERFATAQQMINNVLKSSIKVADDDLVLGDITPNNAKAELSFFYKINKISPGLLKELFATHGIEELEEFQETLESLNFSLRQGYMNGEIDLLFRHNGKYYILDWKTNHLGSQTADYSPAALLTNMAKHYYILQYHIYTLAVHLFLKQQLVDYDYNKDFGGVLYIYTRGVNCNGDGVFFNKPAQTLIEQFEQEVVGST